MEKCIRTPQNDNHNEMHNYRNHATAATQPNRSVKLLLVGGDNANGNQKIEKNIEISKKMDFSLMKKCM